MNINHINILRRHDVSFNEVTTWDMKPGMRLIVLPTQFTHQFVNPNDNDMFEVILLRVSEEEDRFVTWVCTDDTILRFKRGNHYPIASTSEPPTLDLGENFNEAMYIMEAQMEHVSDRTIEDVANLVKNVPFRDYGFEVQVYKDMFRYIIESKAKLVNDNPLLKYYHTEVIVEIYDGGDWMHVDSFEQSSICKDMLATKVSQSLKKLLRKA